MGTWLKPKYFIEPKVADAFIDRYLPMFSLHFGQNQLGRIAVVKATKVSLHLEELFRPIERHGLSRILVLDLEFCQLLRHCDVFQRHVNRQTVSVFRIILTLD